MKSAFIISQTNNKMFFMLKIISHAVKVFLLLIISSSCFSQTETFDIISYTPPKDWKKEAKEGVLNYVNLNHTTGTFCVITMYASAPSKGDAQKDFISEWKKLVVTPYSAEANPKTETQTTADGWEAVTGAAPVKVDGNDAFIILTVISGFGKTVSVRSSFNDQSYAAQVDALFETMELDKTKTPTANNNPETNTNTTVTTQINTGTAKFGLLAYTTPAGWSEQKFQDGVVFKPLDLPAGEHLAIQILQPMNFSGTLEQALAQSFEEATTTFKGESMYQSQGKYGKNAPKISFNRWEYIRGKGSIRIQDGTQFGSEFGLELFVIKINNRFERAAVLESRKYCNGSSLYYASDRVSYRNGIDGLLYSIQFDDNTSQAIKRGSITETDVVGVWQGTMQSTSASGLSLVVSSPIFLPNGLAFFGTVFPREGLYGLNFGIPPELNQRDWATYTFSNGRGVLKMPYGDIPFRKQGNQIIFTKNQTDWPFYNLPSVDGVTFNGTYNMSAVNGKIPSITFTTSGRFTDNGALKELYHEYISCLNPAIAPGSGTYEVKDYTILFNYTDGRKIKLAFLGAGYDKNNLSPPTLQMSFNEDPLTRQ